MLISTIKSNTCKLRQKNYEFEAKFVDITDIKQVEGIQRDHGSNGKELEKEAKEKKLKNF